jgi:hypothetical protein
MDSNDAGRLSVLRSDHFSLLLPLGTPVALMRAARDGSTSIVTFTVIPGFKSAMLARCPPFSDYLYLSGFGFSNMIFL